MSEASSSFSSPPQGKEGSEQKLVVEPPSACGRGLEGDERKAKAALAGGETEKRTQEEEAEKKSEKEKTAEDDEKEKKKKEREMRRGWCFFFSSFCCVDTKKSKCLIEVFHKRKGGRKGRRKKAMCKDEEVKVLPFFSPVDLFSLFPVSHVAGRSPWCTYTPANQRRLGLELDKELSDEWAALYKAHAEGTGGTDPSTQKASVHLSRSTPSWRALERDASSQATACPLRADVSLRLSAP